MRKILIVAFLIVSINDVTAQNKERDVWGYPASTTVINYLYGKLDTGSLGTGVRFELAKKADGWYVYRYDYNVTDNHGKDFVLCWGKRQNKYVLGENNPDKYPGVSELDEFEKHWSLGAPHCYEEEPIYGYEGWTYDVIKLLADSQHLCDVNIEALARAYSNELGYRTGQFGNYVSTSLQFNLGDYPGHMSSAQIDTFRRYNNLACFAFRRLWKQNPAYETFIGSIWIKYCNEVVSGFLALAYNQDLKEGLKEFGTEKLYDPAYLSFAMHLLGSCDKNGILFTNGDNDTYPLYYAQAVLGYRRDVLIVNLSLLNLPMYINFVRQGVFDAPGFPMDIDTASYKSGRFDYVYQEDSDYARFSHVAGIGKTIDKRYLNKADIAVISMLNANAWNRKVYFATSVAPELFLGLDQFLRLHGFVYELQTSRSSAISTGDFPMDVNATYNILMNSGDAVDWAKSSFLDYRLISMLSYERATYLKLALQMSGIGDCYKSIALLNRCIQFYPNDKIPFDAYFMEATNLYLTCKQKTKALDVGDKLFKNALGDCNSTLRDSSLNFEDWNRKMRSSLYVLQELVLFYKQASPGSGTSKFVEDQSTSWRLKYEGQLKLRHAN